MKKQVYSVKIEDSALSGLHRKLVFETYNLTSTFLSSVLAVMLILVFFFRFATVEGSSMNPTLYNDDKIIITSAVWEYKHGDVVVIYREDDTALIKRVIAVENDLIDINFETGDVSVNGVLLTENYIAEPTYRDFADGPDFPVIVPEGHVFVMGDNRNNSIDSRSDDVGFIDVRTIIGKMVWKVDGGN